MQLCANTGAGTLLVYGDDSGAVLMWLMCVSAVCSAPGITLLSKCFCAHDCWGVSSMQTRPVCVAMPDGP
eukprot:scaffold55708_cov19-Tisochrysis_lutea.AAC.2